MSKKYFLLFKIKASSPINNMHVTRTNLLIEEGGTEMEVEEPFEDDAQDDPGDEAVGVRAFRRSKLAAFLRS